MSTACSNTGFNVVKDPTHFTRPSPILAFRAVVVARDAKSDRMAKPLRDGDPMPIEARRKHSEIIAIFKKQ